jgi:superfamily II DNA or RNA helicase
MGLYQHQQDFLKANPNKSALVWSCGTGKSRTAIEWSKEFTIIVCPKALKINWKREIGKYAHRGGQWLVMTKEEFRRDWKSLSRADSIIIDEVHNGFLTPNFKSQMSKALKGYIKKHDVKRVLLLSATVYTSSPWNIYSLAHYLGHKWNWQEFNNMFFDQVWMGQRQIPVVKKGSEKKLAEIVKSIASVVDISDVLDVPLQNHCEPEYFALSKGQEKAIKDSYDPVPIVRYTLQHEIENGVLLGNEFRDSETFTCDKNERILALCAENKKIAIVCRYNAQIDVLAKLLEAYKPSIIRGDVKNRDEVCLKAERADAAVVLIQADCGIGFELPSFELCIYASMSYSYTSWEQMNGRFLRMNKPSRTTFMYLLTEGDSVDQGVYDAVKRKEDFRIELFRK